MNLGVNSCANILEIKGTKNDVITFLKGLYGHTSIYNRYNKKEYIQNKKNEYKKDKYPTFNTYAKIPECVELYGYNDFGDKYYTDNWGTTLDTLMYYSNSIENEINNITQSKSDICLSRICFETFKTPPIKWLEASSKLNPKILFTLEYREYKNNKKYKNIKNGIFL